MINPRVQEILDSQRQLAQELAIIRQRCAHQLEFIRVEKEPSWPNPILGAEGTHSYANAAILDPVVRRCANCRYEEGAKADEVCPYCLKALVDRGQGRSGYADGTDSDPGTHLYGCPTCKYVAEVENEEEW
jgi:hypothetical protein